MKKSVFSRVTTWTIRILLFVVILIGACVLMLSTMGGTSDSHKKGLEQAFSDFANADVEINKVDEFNIIPQLSIKAAGIHGISRDARNEFMLDKIHMAFGFADLMLGRKKIENFQVKNFRFSTDSQYDFRLDHAGIDTQNSIFEAKGQYMQIPFNLATTIGKNSDARPSYYLAEKNDVSGRYGVLDIKGTVVPSSDPKAHIINAVLTSDGEKIGNAYSLRDGSGFKIIIDCAGSKLLGKVKSDLMTLENVAFIKISESCHK